MRRSRIPRSLVRVDTSTVKLAAVTLYPSADRARVRLPVTDEVRPTASVGAGSPASCSRTRYPVTEPVPTVQVPTPGLALAEVAGEAVLAGWIVNWEGALPPRRNQ